RYQTTRALSPTRLFRVFHSEAAHLTYRLRPSWSNRCGVIRIAILPGESQQPWSVPDSPAGLLSGPRFRCAGHEEEHYGSGQGPSSRKGHFRSGLGHTARNRSSPGRLRGPVLCGERGSRGLSDVVPKTVKRGSPSPSERWPRSLLLPGRLPEASAQRGE